MLEKISQNWKGISGLTVAAVFIGVFAFAGPMDALAGDPMSPPPMPPPDTCADGFSKVVHVDKIIFAVNKFLTHPTLPSLKPISGFLYDIKVADDPDTVKYANAEVASFLTAHMYTRGGPAGPGLGPMITPFDIFIVDIDYSIMCAPAK